MKPYLMPQVVSKAISRTARPVRGRPPAWVLRSLAASLVLVISCARGSPNHDAAPQDARVTTPERQSHREVRLSTELQTKWGIGLGRASKVSVSSAVTLPGVLALNQSRTAHISSLLEGKVVSVGADLGDQVRKNQVLLVVHSPAFAQAKTAFLQARARLNLSRQEYDRAKKLLKDQAIDQKEYLRREAEHESAATEYAVLESNLHSFGLVQGQVEELIRRYSQANDDTSLDELADPYLRILSPIDGRIIFRDVIVGEPVKPEKILFTASDLSTLWAIMDARENDLAHLSSGRGVTIRCQAYLDRTFQGRIFQIGDVVDEKLRTIKVRAEVRNDNLLLKPNMYIRGVIANSVTASQVLTVPEEAVQNIEGEPTVFVLEREGVFAVRPVEVGESAASRRAIIKGLDGSETLVVTGAFNLKAELLKSTLGGEQ
jgi:cobalt-zinc-cadmium efflux system membrane fusion protein